MGDSAILYHYSNEGHDWMLSDWYAENEKESRGSNGARPNS